VTALPITAKAVDDVGESRVGRLPLPPRGALPDGVEILDDRFWCLIRW
jgi:hypothetical protein